MENIEKLQVLLHHWIDHNKGHEADFTKWQKIISEEGHNKLSLTFGEILEKVGEINNLLQDALDQTGADSGKIHHHHHHH